MIKCWNQTGEVLLLFPTEVRFIDCWEVVSQDLYVFDMDSISDIAPDKIYQDLTRIEQVFLDVMDVMFSRSPNWKELRRCNFNLESREFK